MKLHANAALSLNQRRQMVCRVEVGRALPRRRGQRAARSLVGAAVDPAPHAPKRVAVIKGLRRLRMTSAEIAECLGMARSTVSAVLTRIGLGKLSRLDPLEPANRYERRAAGELLHVDIKKLGAIIVPGHRVTGNRRQRAHGKVGWQYVHVCVDDATPPGLRRGTGRREGNCNHRRPHGALGHKPPIARHNELNNLPGFYT